MDNERRGGAPGPRATPPRTMRTPTTICLFIPHLAIGGAELQLSLLARELPGAGFRPVVATLESRDAVAADLEAAGIPVRVLPRRGPGGLGTIVDLARLARAEKAELLHAWL